MKGSLYPKKSQFGERFSRRTGIQSLMEDLDGALSGGGSVFMGGGNPARIPGVEKIWRQNLEELLITDRWETALGHYDGPAGNQNTRIILAEYFRKQCGFNIRAENIAVFNGSQTAFFLLLNLLGGKVKSDKDGTESIRRILLPMVPEYIGYADMGLSEGFFKSLPPKIEKSENRQFKYKIDFEKLTIDDTISAICVSRPTNPSGNVLTDDEIKKLDKTAAQNSIPLIIDSAYGLPFPGIVYTKCETYWHPGIIHVYSLSKLGLPGLRTGIVIAEPGIIESLSRINAIVSLASGGFGQALTERLFLNDDLKLINETQLLPFYKQRREFLLDCIQRKWRERFSYWVHKSEGAFFVWVWFPDLAIHSKTLYERLKQKGLLVISGHYFFYGLNEDFPHSNQCIRLSFTQSPEVLEKGVEILGEELSQLHS